MNEGRNNPFDDDIIWEDGTHTADADACVSHSQCASTPTSKKDTENSVKPVVTTTKKIRQLPAQWKLHLSDHPSVVYKIRSVLERHVKFAKTFINLSLKLSTTMRKVDARAAALSGLLQSAVLDDSGIDSSMTWSPSDVLSLLRVVVDDTITTKCLGSGSETVLGFQALEVHARDAMKALDELERRRKEADRSRKNLERFLDKQQQSTNKNGNGGDLQREANLKKKVVESETNHINSFTFAKTRLDSFARDFPSHINRCFSLIVNGELDTITNACLSAPQIYQLIVEALKNDIIEHDASSEQAVTMSLCRDSITFMEKMSFFKKADAMKVQLDQLLSANKDLNNDVKRMAVENAALQTKNIDLTGKIRELEQANNSQRRRSLNLSEDCSLLRSKLEKSEIHIEDMEKKIELIRSEHEKDKIAFEESERQADAGKWHKRVLEKLTEEHKQMRCEIEQYKNALKKVTGTNGNVIIEEKDDSVSCCVEKESSTFYSSASAEETNPFETNYNLDFKTHSPEADQPRHIDRPPEELVTMSSIRQASQSHGSEKQRLLGDTGPS